MVGMDGFAPGIPACSEGGKPCVVTCGLVGGPPFFQLLIPSLTVCCSADTDMSSPYGGMSSGVHRDLLLACCNLLWCAVRSTNRLIDNIGCAYQTVQRIDVMEIMNDIHIRAGSTPPARSGGCDRGRGAQSRLCGRDAARRAGSARG